MKLSFSLQSKPSTKPNSKQQKFTNEEEDEEQQEHNHRHNTTTTDSNKEFVTEFDATRTLTAKPSKVIIPPIQNEWRPTKRMKNLQSLPALQADGSRELEFETESISNTDHADDNMSYGLNIRQGTVANKADQNGDGNVRSSDNVEAVILQKLKTDLDRLPEHRGMEEFQDMPVEGFGAALLAGYGWYEGRGIGKNAKEDVKVMEIKKRTAKEGLGFDSSAMKPVIDKSDRSTNSHGNSHRETQKEKEKVKEKYRDGYFVGTNVRVISGQDMGLKGTIVERLGADSVFLKLRKTEKEVKVRIEDIANLGSKEEDRCLRKLKELKIQEGKDSKQSGYRDSEKHSRASKRSRDIREVKVEKEHQKVDKGSVSWLRSHIRVRIVSKDFKAGRLYLKKGEVVDVVGPTTCDISMDENRELIQGVDQELLETALPKRGGPVLVLNGKHRGVYGSLVERDLDRETGVVRDADSHDLLNVRLEQIAEYVGDPSYLGY